MDKKYWIGIATSVIILPTLIFGWKNINALWASPEKVEKIEKKVDKQDEVQTQLTKLIVEQNARMDKQEAISNLQVKALEQQIQSSKEQVALIADIKKYKK